jgi:hypothetical protein
MESIRHRQVRLGQGTSEHGSRVALFVVLLGLAVASAHVEADSATKAPSAPIGLSTDPRLGVLLESDLRGRPIAVLLQEVSRLVGVPLSTDTATGDQKIIVFTQKTPLRRLLAVLAQHGEWRWIAAAQKSPNGGVSTPGYRLVEPRVRTERAAFLRESANRTVTRQMRERLDQSIQALDASLLELRDLRRQNPSIGNLTHPAVRARLQLTALLDAAERERLVNGQPYVSPPAGELQQSARDLIAAAAGLSDRSAVPLASLRYLIRRESVDGSHQLWFRVVDPATGQQVGSAGTLIPFEPPRKRAGVPIPTSLISTNPAPRDGALQREMVLEDRAGVAVEVSAGLPAVLDALSRSTGFDILCDYYADQSLRFDPDPLGKRPLWQLLNLIGAQYDLEWKRDQNFILFRHRHWYEDDLKEIPERILALWSGDKTPRERVSARDFLKVLGQLSDSQLEDLPFQFRGVSLSQPVLWERYLSKLTEKQQTEALDGKPLLPDTMTQQQRAMLMLLVRQAAAATTPAPDDPLRVELREDREFLDIALAAGEQTWRHRIMLPMKAPPAVPPIIKGHNEGRSPRRSS